MSTPQPLEWGGEQAGPLGSWCSRVGAPSKTELRRPLPVLCLSQGGIRLGALWVRNTASHPRQKIKRPRAPGHGAQSSQARGRVIPARMAVEGRLHEDLWKV